MEELKIKAFCEYANCEEEDLNVYGNTLEYDGETWLILTNEEANEAEEEILEEDLNCILQNRSIPEWVERYFDRESWIEDNKGERGDIISTRNGVEVEMITENENGNLEYFYGYRID